MRADSSCGACHGHSHNGSRVRNHVRNAARECKCIGGSLAVRAAAATKTVIIFVNIGHTPWQRPAGIMAVTALFNRKIEMVIGLFVDTATAILARAVYGLALGGSISLEIRAPLLDAVPLSLGPAAFLYFFTRIAFPRARRTALLIEAGFVIIVLGLSLACLSYLGAMIDLPLRDGEMIWVDRQIGFDWLAVMRALDHSPGVLALLEPPSFRLASGPCLCLSALWAHRRPP